MQDKINNDQVEPEADQSSKAAEAETVSAEPIPPAEQPAAEATETPPSTVVVGKQRHRLFRPENLFPSFIRNRLGRAARPLAIAGLCIIVLGAGGGVTYWKLTAHSSPKPTVASSFKLPVTPFRLVSTVPSSDATDVNTATAIVLNFNQPVNPNKMINNMFVTPTVTGTYKQGDNKDQIVFTPSKPLAQGTKFSVMVNGTYQNTQGSQLGTPYSYGFTTSIPNNEVDFQDQTGLIDQVTSLASGQKEAYTVQVGNSVGTGASVTVYKGTVSSLLSSLVYTTTTTDGYPSSSFSDLSVSTTGLQSVQSVPNIKDNATFTVQQPDGVYVAVATDAAGKEVGFVWIIFSNFGVLLRQDDQKAVLDAQTYADAKEVSADVRLYNLKTVVTQLAETTVNGLTTEPVPYSPSLDMAVATYNGETVVVPVNVVNSGGDIRVDQDLHTAAQVYGVTDRPTYKVGTDIQYSGFVRSDEDAQYINPASGTVKLYVAHNKGDSPLAAFTASIDSNGMFSGKVSAVSSWITSGDVFDQLQLFAASTSGNQANDIPVASFTLTTASNPSSVITAAFSQPSYLPGDPIAATLSAVDASGQPLANTTVQVHVFSQDYYEADTAANLENFGYTGNELPGSPVSIQLNAQGQAVYTIKPATLPNDGRSQTVTVQVQLPNQSGVGAAGGASAIVHQGDGTLRFGVGRTTVPKGSDLTSRVYAAKLDGSPITSGSLKYRLVDTTSSKVIASGTAETDATGSAGIDIPATNLTANGDGMELTVSMLDEHSNTVQASSYYSVADSTWEAADTSGANLLDLDVTGSSGAVKVGDTVSLTINAPADLRALVTMDRGRIYHPGMINLTKGNTNYSLTITPDLAPSFTLTFNYFMNGTYHSEGAYFTVSESQKHATVVIAPSAQTVSANQPTTVTISSEDASGQPLPSTMIVDVVSSNAYSLSSSVNPDIFSALYTPRPIMTSSSSSLSPIGSGGGRCGGGGGDLPSFANAIGTTLFWQPVLSTDSNGQASVTFTPSAGSWTINAYAMSGMTVVGSRTSSFQAK